MAEFAFPPHIRTRLASGKYTSWAVDLPEDTLEALLWMIGEFGVRAPARPTADGHPEIMAPDRIMNRRAKEALRTIAAIVRGERIDVDEARHRMRLAVASSQEGPTGDLD